MLTTSNQLLPSGNRLPESKTLGKRFFFEKFSWTKLCYSIFWKTLLILILIESSLESWILIKWLLDSWNLLWLNDSLILKTCFDWTILWFLKWVFDIIKIILESIASMWRNKVTSQCLNVTYHPLMLKSILVRIQPKFNFKLVLNESLI